jgi:hypothetical protein
MLQEKKYFNRMSIEHILCTPYDNYTYTHDHGLPSPISTCYSSEEDDDDASSSSSLLFTHSPLNSTEPYNDHRINIYQQHCRAILPYRRRRKMSNSGSGQLDSGGQKRMPWLPEEDALLKHGFEQGLSWAMIASTYLPHRSRGCCWGRFKTLKNKKFLNVRRQIRVQSKPWKTLNPTNMQL